MSLWAFRSFVEDGRATLRSWRDYENQTGRRPWFWIAVHILNWALAISWAFFVIWLAVNYHFSNWKFICIFLLIGLPYSLFWLWLKNKVKLDQLRNQRRLRKATKSV